MKEIESAVLEERGERRVVLLIYETLRYGVKYLLVDSIPNMVMTMRKTIHRLCGVVFDKQGRKSREQSIKNEVPT